jgi:flagellar biogenesis protein FliO
VVAEGEHVLEYLNGLVQVFLVVLAGLWFLKRLFSNSKNGKRARDRERRKEREKGGRN